MPVGGICLDPAVECEFLSRKERRDCLAPVRVDRDTRMCPHLPRIGAAARRDICRIFLLDARHDLGIVRGMVDRRIGRAFLKRHIENLRIRLIDAERQPCRVRRRFSVRRVHRRQAVVVHHLVVVVDNLTERLAGEGAGEGIVGTRGETYAAECTHRVSTVHHRSIRDHPAGIQRERSDTHLVGRRSRRLIRQDLLVRNHRRSCKIPDHLADTQLIHEPVEPRVAAGIRDALRSCPPDVHRLLRRLRVVTLGETLGQEALQVLVFVMNHHRDERTLRIAYERQVYPLSRNKHIVGRRHHHVRA